MKRTEKQLKMVSSVPRTEGGDTLVTWSIGVVQLGARSLKAWAEQAEKQAVATKNSKVMIMTKM